MVVFVLGKSNPSSSLSVKSFRRFWIFRWYWPPIPVILTSHWKWFKERDGVSAPKIIGLSYRK